MHRHSHGTCSGRASYGSPEPLSSRELPAHPCRHLVCQALQHRCVDAVVDGDHVIVFCEGAHDSGGQPRPRGVVARSVRGDWRAGLGVRAMIIPRKSLSNLEPLRSAWRLW